MQKHTLINNFKTQEYKYMYFIVLHIDIHIFADTCNVVFT